jgi:hypothetical protein
MSPLVRRSILKKFLMVVSCALSVCVPAALTLAQRPAVGTAGGAVHISAPPISHVPISSAPMIHAPISTPRISLAPVCGRTRYGWSSPSSASDSPISAGLGGRRISFSSWRTILGTELLLVGDL